MLLYILIGLFLALNVADVLSTNAVIRNGGHESNPLAARLMEWCGDLWWAPKMGMAIGISAILIFLAPPFWAVAAAVLINAAWAYVVWHNWNVWRRQEARKRKLPSEGE